jgi:hypothetical protein
MITVRVHSMHRNPRVAVRVLQPGATFATRRSGLRVPLAPQWTPWVRSIEFAAKLACVIQVGVISNDRSAAGCAVGNAVSVDEGSGYGQADNEAGSPAGSIPSAREASP